MDQVLSDHARENDQMERIVSALSGGMVFVDSKGRISWIDPGTRRRLNGGLQSFAPLAHRSDRSGMACSASAIDVMVGGKRVVLCLIQEIGEEKEASLDATTAIEAVLSDSSWLIKAIVDKVKGLRQIASPSDQSSDVDTLTRREREVLSLICEGRNDGEMGAILNLSRNTVRNHVAALYRKIGVNRRGAAIIWARERAIVDRVASHPKRPGRPAAAPRSNGRDSY